MKAYKHERFSKYEKKTLKAYINYALNVPIDDVFMLILTKQLLHNGSRGQNECHLNLPVLGNISTAFLALSVDGNISTNRTVYEKGTLARRALNNKH